MGYGYDISFSCSESNANNFVIEFGAPERLPANPPVKIGSLPKLGPLFYHLTLAVAAAVLVHLAIYLYNL